ncbi:Malonyl CoA-acyl carrier protein transacylase [Symbiodinium microadriaticum]|uniref:Malonyl CoA-acyl carrier protein transacylase n=1 Tax=Symbiodinium microadriaticum TaxID=2951 RepID=A0A1Q9CY37_SYMMI|nr:Malonyl CoA-acyl carrier protein transacylase [Symbiodinium microadriaticum]
MAVSMTPWYLGMARGLYEQVALFQRIADQCCEQLASPHLLGQVLQPALFVVEYARQSALSQIFLAVNDFGVASSSAWGPQGEASCLRRYSAAVVGGFLSLDAALAIVAARARSTETLAEEGAMLSVADWSSEELEAVAGGSRSTETLAEEGAMLSVADWRKCSRLHVKRAFHSGLIAKAKNSKASLVESFRPPVSMENVLIKGAAAGYKAVEDAAALAALVFFDDAAFTALVGAVVLTGRVLRHFRWRGASNLTGQWLHQAHMKVLWRENAERLMSQWRPAIVLEVGPGNVLSTLTSKCVGPGNVLSTLTSKCALLGALGKLWEAGCPVNFDQLHTKAYAFEATPLWVNPERYRAPEL